jgi:hypothetical protein
VQLLQWFDNLFSIDKQQQYSQAVHTLQGLQAGEHVLRL